MATTKTVSTRTTAPRGVVEQRIQWGNIIKGAIIIGAVAVAGVVGFNLAAGIVGPFIAGNPALASFFGGVGQAFTGLFNLAGSALSWAGGFLGGAAAPALEATGVSGAAATAAATPAATGAIVAQVAGWAAAAGAVFLSFPIVKKLFSTMPLVAPEHVTIAGKVEHQVTQVKTPESAIVTEKNMEGQAPASAWADRVAQTERREITPRDASHVDQAAKDAALAAATQAAR